MAIITNTKKKMLDDLLALGTLKAMLLDAPHATNIATQNFISSVSANQSTATGYTAGGVTITGITTAVSGTAVTLDFADIALTGLTGTFTHIAFYVDTGVPATSPIIDIEDITNQSLSAENYTYTVNASGKIVL